MWSLFGGKENFRRKLEDRVVDLYKDRVRDFYTTIGERELKQLVKDKRYDLGKIIVSTANEFWTVGEEEPGPGVERITQMPCIPTNFYETKEVFKKVLEEKSLPENERTYRPEKIYAPKLIADQNNFLKNLMQSKRLVVKDPVRCNRLIVRIFRFLEGEMDFKYGSDMENFGYRNLALTPVQAYAIKKSGWEEFKDVAIDCEDMHHFAAACFKAAGMNGRYRLVLLEWEEGGEKRMHDGLCVMDDTFEKFRILELTPYRRNISRFTTIRSFPVFGEDRSSVVKPENVIGSYDDQRVYGSFKLLEEREPVDKWIMENVTEEKIVFPDNMFY